ncbi:Gag polyprotein [Vulpes lagopus]
MPTWDDYQQLLQVFFTTEEREQIQVKAQKSALVEDRQLTQNPDHINAVFPLSCPTWDHNSAEGKERLQVHHQTLMAGPQAAMCKPTDLAKVYDVRQVRTRVQQAS